MSQTISYTSGSTRAGTVTYSKTDEITVSSLGTTVKARTKVGQVTVTYTGEGSVIAKKTVDIYQAENKVTNSNYNPRITAYGTPTISIGSGLTAAGGSASVSTSVTNTETYNTLYSSGATGNSTTVASIPSLSINGDGFTLANNIVTASKNNVGARSCTVTSSREGAVSQTITITQLAGPDGIGYMQIEGNGVDHYIFQVGRTPNTRSNDVQTLSEEPAEVATETKSESLFAKIKRIVTNLN